MILMDHYIQTRDHPYSSDLDIFGYHSLFHFINRGNTKSGMDTLAEWLKRSTTGKEIYRRQESIRELAEKSEFRQSVMIQADLRKRGKAASEEDLDNLLSHEPFVSNSPFLKSVIHIVPLMTIGAFAAIFAGVNYLWFLGLIVLQMLINMRYSSGVKKFFEKTGKVVSGISIYTGIIDISEKESFNSDLLKNIRERFIGESGNAGKKISKLSGYIDNLELRRSTLHGLVNNILFWDLNNIFRSEKWLEQSGGQITDWLKACGEIESLSSLATFSFNTPSATFPSVSEKRYHYRAKEMGHPLLKQEERVCNDFNMENEGRVIVITGPNMAGKSTFLRTVGINAILAMAGSVVTAENLELSIMDIHSSMKISDSLDKGISLFYAELRRLKDITDASKSGASGSLSDR